MDRALSRRLSGTIALVVLILSVYAPFIGSRVVRTAGDEKVYVSQALEMERNHSWFVQTLQDEPDYLKGPMHYLLLRAGFIVFGHRPWAALYMNPLFVLLGALSLAAVVRRRFPHWEGGDLWTGAAFAFGTGIYAHSFASQMEVELAGLFAIALFFLDRLRTEDAGWAFWCVAGLAGWAKSPLHSAFLGSSALLYWTLEGQLARRLRNPRAWLAVLLGIALCVGGYLPAFFLDRQNFWDTYVIRETLRKSDGSGQGWSVAVVSSFGFYLFPWLLLALVAYAQTLASVPRLLRERATRSCLSLAFSFFLPSVAFFCWHVYRFENYNLPVIAGIWLWIACVWAASPQASRGWSRAYGVALGITGLVFLAFPVALTILSVHFAPLPSWWPAWLVPFAWAGSLASCAGFLWFGLKQGGRRPHWLALSSAGFLWALGAFLAVVGEREMIDLNQYLADARAAGREVSLGYYNLNRNIWSEWGYLGLWVGHEVHGLHTPEALQAALKRRETILVSAKENGIQDFRDFVAKNDPGDNLRVIPWKRWRTRGQTDSGKPLWLEAWDKRDLSLLEVDYLIVDPGGPGGSDHLSSR